MVKNDFKPEGGQSGKNGNAIDFLPRFQSLSSAFESPASESTNSSAWILHEKHSIKDIATIKSSEISTSLELKSLTEWKYFQMPPPSPCCGGEGRETQENERQDGREVKQKEEDGRERRGCQQERHGTKWRCFQSPQNSSLLRVLLVLGHFILSKMIWLSH